jgi:poly(A) polymerase
MLIRYKKGKDGTNIPVAEIYTSKEHGIDSKMIDLDAVWAIRKLKQSGAEAYIVGGAVRDLLLGRKPKDFDIATSATPRQVQKLFWNGRIIGKRFKLVHLVFKDKILEVSTFRSGEDGGEDPTDIYGTIDQDAKRRDYTVNALYYDPTDGMLYDFNKSMLDFKRRRIRSVLPLTSSFIEDPVRMIRAIKYSVTTGFALQFDVKRAMKRHATELAKVSSSRLTEEVTKILSSGDSAAIFNELYRHKLLVYLLPCVSVFPRMQEIYDSLTVLDEKVSAMKQSPESADDGIKGEMFASLVRPIVNQAPTGMPPEDAFKEMYSQVKTLISPMTPPNYDVEKATVLLLADADISVPKNCLKARRPIRQPGTMGFKVRHPKRQRKAQQSSSHQGKGGSGKNRRRKPRRKGDKEQTAG